MEQLTIDSIRKSRMLLFEAVSGSKAYGLDTATSDTDIKGVFVLPEDQYYGLGYTPQVSNETNDIVFYELGRFIELLAKNNPNIMEMLAVPEQLVIYRHPVMGLLESEIFLSKLCQQTFANYAMSQIKKAYGLEKKILNPVEKNRKRILDFCFVYEEKKALPLKVFLETKQLDQAQIGLAAVNHFKGCYNMYYAEGENYTGIVKKENANDVSLSSVPKNEKPLGLLYFNKEGYSAYCKLYKSYWDWVDKRNDARYNTTMEHGKKYDSKNMMHVFRLLLMAKEIATEGKIKVVRNDREFLLSIKAGDFEYDDLLARASVLQKELPGLYKRAALADEPDMEKVNKLLINMRKEYYRSHKNKPFVP